MRVVKSRFYRGLKCGRKKGQGSILKGIAEQIVVEVRRKTLLPLDDLLMVLKPIIPELTRSNLHRCLQRNNVSRIKDLLPEDEQKQRKSKKFKEYPPGYLHIDTSEIRIGKKKYYLFVAIDRATRYAYVELHENKTSATAAMFLKNALQQYPFKIQKILTDNGVEFSYNALPDNKKPKNKIHLFVKLCEEKGIEHRTTLVKHPWTNGMVEAMNKKIKEHTSKKYHYEDINQFKKHLYYYLLNYNFNLKLRALRYKTPYESMEEWYQKSPQIFHTNPNHLIVGLKR